MDKIKRYKQGYKQIVIVATKADAVVLAKGDKNAVAFFKEACNQNSFGKKVWGFVKAERNPIYLIEKDVSETKIGKIKNERFKENDYEIVWLDEQN